MTETIASAYAKAFVRAAELNRANTLRRSAAMYGRNASPWVYEAQRKIAQELGIDLTLSESERKTFSALSALVGAANVRIEWLSDRFKPLEITSSVHSQPELPAPDFSL